MITMHIHYLMSLFISKIGQNFNGIAFSMLSNHNFCVSNPLYLFWSFNPLWTILFHTPFYFLISLFSFKKPFFLFSSFQDFINGSQTKGYSFFHQIWKGWILKISRDWNPKPNNSFTSRVFRGSEKLVWKSYCIWEMDWYFQASFIIFC